MPCVAQRYISKLAPAGVLDQRHKSWRRATRVTPGPGALPLVCSRFVRRVSVVGSSGSGKSTLASELAARLHVPHVELDAIFHQPGWTPLPEEEFTAAVAAAVAADGWVVDGNYSAVRPLVWARADT